MCQCKLEKSVRENNKYRSLFIIREKRVIFLFSQLYTFLCG